ncbi:MAG TPA: hypothetical protein PKC55_10695 [Dysgonomonas sp.]|uniref:hypothetical protein n=1 Tax=unclassified Dysgonomonas TaxID=2630389 RepID=UPI0025C6799F|nr:MULTISPECIES: hypothetical protein [unclassified Dysgonomonas]HML65288.1 hypothetical protein [Dysgonomonas sp.]
MGKHTLTPGFVNIPIRDLLIWVKVFKSDGIILAEEIQKELTLIDDLLTLQKSQSLLNRKRKLKDQLEDRIGAELGLSPSYQITCKKKL